jgi:hypothetical protein
MTFDENTHPRATDGKFAEKLGAAPEVGIHAAAGPASLDDVANAAKRIDPEAVKLVFTEQANGGPRVMKLHDKNNAIVDYGVGKWDELEAILDQYDYSSTAPRIRGTQHPDFQVVQESRLTPDVEKLSSFLSRPQVSTEDITLSEVDKLRWAVEQAEFRLAEKELGKLMARDVPDGKGVVVARYGDGNAFPLGIETVQTGPGSDRNWGVIDYDNVPDSIREWFDQNHWRFDREDDYLDTHAEILCNSTGDFEDDELPGWDNEPVYRVAVPE